MKRLKRWPTFAAITACVLSYPLGLNLALAQQSDPLAINGTLGDTTTWTLTLHGLSFDDYYQVISNDPYDFYARYVRRVYATRFDFEFQGPDAEALNAVFGTRLESGFLFFEIRQVIATDFDWGGLTEYGDWWIQIQQSEIVTEPGIFFYAAPSALEQPFSVDENGYPLIETRVSVNTWAGASDEFGTENSYDLGDGLGNLVAFDAPLPPPPPPSPPALSIANASVWEGNKGTTRLDLTVTLSRSSTSPITVHYTTANGTALANSDYAATSGNLAIQPGQTQGTISISVTGDRKREPNESFFVQLSNVVGAEIRSGVATVTILNDD